MNRNGENIKISKIGLGKLTKSYSCIPDCYTPPPPPFGEEDGWDLQFCKWWGWNWVKKEYPNRQPNNFTEQLIEKGAKRGREAGDTVTFKQRKQKSNYFKQLRNFFLKIKRTSSLQRVFNTPSPSQCCYRLFCNHGVKRKEAFNFNKTCFLEETDQAAQMSSKEEIGISDTTSSRCFEVSSSLKRFGPRHQQKESFQKDLSISKTDSFQQTDEKKKNKKKKYYHLVCSNCYPQICCCRCHKRTDNKEIQHTSYNVRQKQQDEKNSKSLSGPKQKNQETSYYNHQRLPYEDMLKRKRKNDMKQKPIELPKLQRTYQTENVLDHEYSLPDHAFMHDLRTHHDARQNKELYTKRYCPYSAKKKTIEKETFCGNFDSSPQKLSESSSADNPNLPEKPFDLERSACLHKKAQKHDQARRCCVDCSKSSEEVPLQENSQAATRLKRQRLYQDLFPQDCPTYQNLLPFLQAYSENNKPHPVLPHPYSNNEDIPCKKPRIVHAPDTYETYQNWNRVTYSKNMFPKFGTFAHKYPQIQNTKSDILDKYYSFKMEEEFFSPASVKQYSVLPKTLDPVYYSISSLPDPIDVEEDLKYLEHLEASLKLNRSSRMRLDAVCDAILLNNDSGDLTVDRKYSYTEYFGKNAATYDEKEISENYEWNPDEEYFPTKLPVNFEVLFMERVDTLVKSILNSKFSQCENSNDSSRNNESKNFKRTGSPVSTGSVKKFKLKEIQTESEQSSKNSFTDQVEKLNNLFEKMDELTRSNKANVEKIQEKMKPLSQSNDNTPPKYSDQQSVGINLEFFEYISNTIQDQENMQGIRSLSGTNITNLIMSKHINSNTNPVNESIEENEESDIESTIARIRRKNNLDSEMIIHKPKNIEQISDFMFQKHHSDFSIGATLSLSQNTVPDGKKLKVRDAIKARKLRKKIRYKRK